MPRQFLMTWVPAQSRWIKQHKGRTYSVSAKQLNAPATKGQSWMHANAWWEAKQKEIEAAERAAQPPEVSALDTLLDALARLPDEQLADIIDRGNAARNARNLRTIN